MADEAGQAIAIKFEVSTDEALRRLLNRLTPELRQLLDHGENFKVIINGSAGKTFDIEVNKRIRLN